MCGRAKLTTPPELLRDLFALRELPDLPPRYNIAPTQPLAVVRQPGKLDLVRFGFLPAFARVPSEGTRFLNARAETVANQPAFREAFRSRRCLVVVDGFYEWEHEGKKKRPYLVHLPNGAPFALAGIWTTWTSREGDTIESAAVVTAAAQGAVARLHDRMPIILAPDTYAAWLDPTTTAPETLLRSASIEDLVVERVSEVGVAAAAV